MNRRDFLAAGFKLGAAGLLLPLIEPARKVWALDRTMLPRPTPFAGKSVFSGWERDHPALTFMYVDDLSPFRKYELIWVGDEPMIVVDRDARTRALAVLRDFYVTPQV